ncbi:hypothetical protein BDD12DRAFT_808914 [Trichophaea hybrida]|nr:hypothetical protein BDD12DRAFT_808914 [Trichophaea hybrida]
MNYEDPPLHKQVDPVTKRALGQETAHLRHLAGHMQQLSLFVSGPWGTNDSEEMASEGAQVHGSKETFGVLDQPQIPSIRFIPIKTSTPGDNHCISSQFRRMQCRSGLRDYSSSFKNPFRLTKWQWYVKRFTIASPTCLNGAFLDHHEHYRLNSGDILQLGDDFTMFDDHNCVMIKVEMNPRDMNSNIDDRLEFDSNPSRQSDEGDWDQFPHDVADSSSSPPDLLSINFPPLAVSSLSSSIPDDPHPDSPLPLPNFDQHKVTFVNEAPGPPFTADEEEAFSKFLEDEGRYTRNSGINFRLGLNCTLMRIHLFIIYHPLPDLYASMHLNYKMHIISGPKSMDGGFREVTARDVIQVWSSGKHHHGPRFLPEYIVQFVDQLSCVSALQHEQGATVRGSQIGKLFRPPANICTHRAWAFCNWR